MACMHFYPARKYLFIAHGTCECCHMGLDTMSKNNLRLITLGVRPVCGIKSLILYLPLDRGKDRVCGGGGGEAGLVS